MIDREAAKGATGQAESRRQSRSGRESLAADLLIQARFYLDRHDSSRAAALFEEARALLALKP